MRHNGVAWGSQGVRSNDIIRLGILDRSEPPRPRVQWKAPRARVATVAGTALFAVAVLSDVLGLLSGALGLRAHLTDKPALTPSPAPRAALRPAEHPALLAEPMEALPSPTIEPEATRPTVLSSVEEAVLPQPLNVLVFDAVDSRLVLDAVVRNLRKRYPDSTIESQFSWRGKERMSPMSTTLIVWRARVTKPLAICLQQQLPGPQRVEGARNWEFDAARDVAIFVGEDWRSLEAGLQNMTDPCHRDTPLAVTPEQVLECLDREGRRATVGAIAASADVSAQSVRRLLGAGRSRASSVVSEEEYLEYLNERYGRWPPRRPLPATSDVIIGHEADLLSWLDACGRG